MAKIEMRNRKSLPKDPAYKAGYDQACQDFSTAILTYFQQRFISDEDRPEKNTPEYTRFLEDIRLLSRFLKDERKKAMDRVKSAAK